MSEERYRNVYQEISKIRRYQEQRWGTEHDLAHEPFEWLGLIAEYAARGRYVDAAALCIAADSAREERARRDRVALRLADKVRAAAQEARGE